MTLSQSSGGRPAISPRSSVTSGWESTAFSTASEKAVAVDRERAAGRHLMGVGAAHDNRAHRPHLAMQDADGVGRGVVGAERVRADELGEAAGVMGGRSAHGAHFVKHDGNAGLGRLPRRLRAGEAAADDVDRTHGGLVTKGGGGVKRVSSKPTAPPTGPESTKDCETVGAALPARPAEHTRAFVYCYTPVTPEPENPLG